VKHEGSGRPWVLAQALAAVPLTKPRLAGFRLEKQVTPIEKKAKDKWSRGDVARVSLTLTAPTEMTWVVVDDPIPGGATILGSGLGRDSALFTRGEKSSGAWPSSEERSFEAMRAYYEYVPQGTWKYEYTVRLNNEGTFQLPASRVEAMYAPEMFAEIPNADWAVTP
jgi:uncharacterized protein YfaS (alpha-2-macroglobulin family)